MKSFLATLLIGIFVISAIASDYKERSYKFLEIDAEIQEDAIGIFMPIQDIIAINNQESDEDDSIGVHVPLYIEEEDQGETINIFVPMEEFLFEVKDQTYEEDSLSNIVSSEIFIQDEEKDSIGIFVPIEAPETGDEQEDAIAVYVSMGEIVDGVANEEEYMIVQDIEVEVIENKDDEIEVFVPLDKIIDLSIDMF